MQTLPNSSFFHVNNKFSTNFLELNLFNIRRNTPAATTHPRPINSVTTVLNNNIASNRTHLVSINIKLFTRTFCNQFHILNCLIALSLVINNVNFCVENSALSHVEHVSQASMLANFKQILAYFSNFNSLNKFFNMA